MSRLSITEEDNIKLYARVNLKYVYMNGILGIVAKRALGKSGPKFHPMKGLQCGNWASNYTALSSDEENEDYMYFSDFHVRMLRLNQTYNFLL